MKKYIIVILLILPFAAMGQVSPIDNLFAKYADSKNIESVEIAKALFSSLNSIKNNSLLDKLSNIRVMSVDYTENPGKKRAAAELRKEIAEEILPSGYEKLININNSGEKINIYLSATEPKHVVMLIDEENEFTFIIINGKITESVILDIIKGDISIK